MGKKWKADYLYYIEKAARLGFDILEIAATPLPDYSDLELRELRSCAESNGITLTCGHGPSPAQNLASSDPAVRAAAKVFYTDLLKRLEKLDIHLIGGGIYSYWPVDYSKPIDKAGDWGRSVEGVADVSKIARDCGVAYCLEVLNRFEGYLLNTAEEAVKFAREVDNPQVKVWRDISRGADEAQLDEDARAALEFSRYMLDFKESADQADLHIRQCAPEMTRVPAFRVRDASGDV